MFTSQDYVPMYAWMQGPMVVQGTGIVRGDQHTLFHLYSLQLHHSNSYPTSYSILTFCVRAVVTVTSVQ